MEQTPKLPERLRRAGAGAEPLEAGPQPPSVGPCLISLSLDWTDAKEHEGCPRLVRPCLTAH